MNDDDKTVMRPPRSGEDPAVLPDLRAEPLQPGSRVREFVIESTIAFGGFGIVYLARDELLGREVAVKEYLPESLAYRASDVSVRVRSSSQADTFALGLESFIKEAKTLASFDDPALVKVYQFWQQNGTAYMVMPYYRGPTLKQALTARTEPPDEVWLRSLLDALLNALEVLHKEHWYHRDVAPDNILLLNGVVPVLLDFGAARRVIEDHAKTLTVILKPGYAPVEQYGEAEGLTQGPWTDLYALAAVMYMAIVGRAPPPSVSRAVRDTIAPLSELVRGRFSEPFLRTIDKALSVHPAERPQSVAEFRALLGQAASPDPISAARSKAQNSDGLKGKSGPWGGRLGLIGGVATAMGLIGGVIWWLSGGQTGMTQPPQQVSPGVSAPSPVATAPALTAPVTKPAASAISDSTPPASETAPTPTPPIAQKPTLPALPADPLEALFAGRDPAIEVRATSDSPTVRIQRDAMRFAITSSVAGTVYIFMRGTRNELILLFPNRLDQRNRIEPGQRMRLPNSNWMLTAGGPAGSNRFVAIVSASPREFAAAGARTDGAFLAFNDDNLAKVAASQAASPTPVLAGQVKCSSGSGCSTAYGAARFEIREVP